MHVRDRPARRASSTTSATGTTTARGWAARYIARSLFLESLRGAYGLGRSAKSKVMPMLLFAVICLPAVIIVVIATVTNDDELPGDYTVLRPQPAACWSSVFLAAQAPRASRATCASGSCRCTSRGRSSASTTSWPSTPRWRPRCSSCWPLPLTILFVGALLAKLPLDEQVPDYLRSLVGAAALALVLAGIGLVIAAFTPRRGLGVAAVIAVLLVLAGVQGAVQAIAVEQGDGHLRRVRRAVLAVHPGRRA